MKEQIEAIIAPAKSKGLEAGCEQMADLWCIWVGSHGGGRKDGISLARDLMALAMAEPAQRIPEPVRLAEIAEPEPAAIPVQADPRIDLQAARIAELEAMLAAKAEPPPDLADLILLAETPAQTHDRLMRLFADAKQGAELARQYGGSFDGRSTVEWERKAGRYESGIDWNRGRMAEQI